MGSTSKSYTVTAKAGRYLLGRRVKAGDIVMLTESQAAYEVARGIVEEVVEKAEAAPVPAAVAASEAPAVSEAPAAKTV